MFQFNLTLEQATTRNGFVPRLWASRKIGLLVDAIREQGGAPASFLRAKAKATMPAPASSWTRSFGSRPSLAFSRNTRRFWHARGPTSRRRSKVVSEAENLFRSRAIQTRSGLSSVNQDLNNQNQKGDRVREPA